MTGRSTDLNYTTLVVLADAIGVSVLHMIGLPTQLIEGQSPQEVPR